MSSSLWDCVNVVMQIKITEIVNWTFIVTELSIKKFNVRYNMKYLKNILCRTYHINNYYWNIIIICYQGLNNSTLKLMLSTKIFLKIILIHMAFWLFSFLSRHISLLRCSDARTGELTPKVGKRINLPLNLVEQQEG